MQLSWGNDNMNIGTRQHKLDSTQVGEEVKIRIKIKIDMQFELGPE